ncbi:TPA: transketolase [Candidatus Gastranaerophilales bacterium HUM_20]|nr:transketolase C-terminal domain protein [Clostridium sp. CAG:729]DAB18632.1 MAG TPA: transketolase [Candidatus Gastranaerophilales bacterium HUM_20]
MTKTRYTGQAPEKEIIQTFNETMSELFEEDTNVVYLDADLMGSLKTHELWEKYPKNVFNCGIQEANMAGVAAGLYLNGFKPYIHSFSPFASRRIFDQLFLSVGYAKKSVRVIGSDAGIMATNNGGTHMCFEDVAMMRTVPNACVLEATDSVMFRAFLKQTKDREGLTYIRTARRGLKDIYMPDEKFEEGKGKILKEGHDITIIASGIMVATAIEASKILEQQGISAKVVDIITIKPIDEELVKKCAKTTKAIMVAENANVIGGLGSAVCDVLAEKPLVPIFKIGIQDQYGCVGNEQFLREKYEMSAENIVKYAINIL